MYNNNTKISILDSQKILEVSYKTIIDSYEFDHEERGKVTLEAENKKRLYDFKNRNFHSQTINFFSKNITVPPILLHINPRLKEKEYVILKNDPNFLHKVTSVCEECFLIIAKGNIAGGDYNIQRVHTNESTNLFGVGRLRPEILKYRNKLTSRNIKYQSLIEDLRPDINSKRINHLISPTKLLTSDKLFDIDPNNNFGVHLYENMIDIPFRGSYRGSFKEKNSNKNIIPISPFAPLQLNEKNILENVNEYNNEKNSEIDEYEIKEEEEKKNYEKSMEEIKHIPKRFSLKLPLHNLENLQENNEASGNSQTKLDEKIDEQYTQINEKNTQNSCSITDRDSKYLSENHRKIFIPNLKNTTNSCNHYIFSMFKTKLF